MTAETQAAITRVYHSLLEHQARNLGYDHEQPDIGEWVLLLEGAMASYVQWR